jgi:hypothetical protein
MTMAVKRAGRKNYTQMTLQRLRDEGCSVDKVEKYNAFAGPFGRREDAFGFIDILALRPGVGIVAIQSTGPNGHAEHRRSILANEFATQWLECGGRIELWSWRKLALKRGSKALRWQPRIEAITPEAFGPAEEDTQSNAQE